MNEMPIGNIVNMPESSPAPVKNNAKKLALLFVVALILGAIAYLVLRKVKLLPPVPPLAG